MDQLNDQVIQLNEEIDKLNRELQSEKDMNDQKDRLIGELEEKIQASKAMYDVSIKNIQVISENMYQEGNAKGKIFGSFDVSVTVINHSERDLENVKTTAKLETSNRTYPKSLNAKATKLATITTLKAGEEREVVFKGFQIDHPELVQELIINVVDHGEIKKVRLLGAFPPGSKD